MIGFHVCVSLWARRHKAQEPMKTAVSKYAANYRRCLLHLLRVVLVGRIRDCVAALRKVLAGTGHCIASCECGSSGDQQQSDESSHEQFPLSLMRVRWPFGHEHVPDVRIPAALVFSSGLGYDRSLKRFCQVWSDKKTMATTASIDHTGLMNHKKLRVRKL